MKANLFWLCLAFLLGIALCFPIVDPDIFMYLSFGRLMIDQIQIPAVDPYVFTDPRWLIYHEWLSCLIFYIFFWAGGYWGLIVMRIALWLTALWTMIRAGKKWNLPESLVAIIISITILSCVHRFIDRASFFSDLILCFLTGYFLSQEKLSRRALIILPLFFAVWVNLHPAFVLGLALYFLFFISRARSEWSRTGLNLLLCGLACLLNPRFLEGVLFPFQRAFEGEFKAFRKMTPEWMSPFKEPFLSTTEVRFFLILVVLTAGLFIWRFAKKREASLFALLIFVFYLYVAQEAVRFLTTAALSIAMITLFLMRDLKFPILAKWDRPLKICMGTVAIVLGVFIFQNGYQATSGPRHFGAGVDPVNFPIHAAEFIQQNHLTGRIFNQYEWGSFLIWTLNQKDSIFIHTFHSDPKLLTDVYYGMGKSKQQFDSMVEKHNIRYALLERHYFPEKPIILQNLESWKVIFEDGTSTLWERPNQ